ncbi:hypothetical protein BDM02DRAFT_3227784 [Thelephora ganbajun]|uniref:Uncharacterized protein n=1 Tax=Thelephora ganbajun TaxID=370292 RepID=A0ACB6Z118_THEGA|nr:hypothetical protein BDM02DRAFT_3227784 [Thelephora ganbajun]
MARLKQLCYEEWKKDNQDAPHNDFEKYWKEIYDPGQEIGVEFQTGHWWVGGWAMGLPGEAPGYMEGWGAGGNKGEDNPILSDKERKILSEYDGCFKCRHPYIGHQTCKCPNGFPQEYRQVTTAMAEAVCDEQNHVAWPIATVFDLLCLEENLPSAVLGSGNEESDDSEL